jgi:NTP pyrophosphatase (non-canonical NTP hydrolase)
VESTIYCVPIEANIQYISMNHTLIQEEIEHGIRCEAWRKQTASILKLAFASLIDEVINNQEALIEKWRKGRVEHNEDLSQMDCMSNIEDELRDLLFYMGILIAQENIGELQKCARFYEITKLVNAAPERQSESTSI